MIKNLIIGGTFFGCGLASQSPSDSLLLEPGIVPGSDFSLQFNSGTQWDAPLKTEDAREYLNELKQRSALLDSCHLHTGALAPLLSEWCRKRSITIEYGCTPIEIGEHCVKAMGVGGMEEIQAENIIDARPAPKAFKYMTALLYTPDQRISDQTCELGELSATPVQEEIHLSIQVPFNFTYQQATLLLHEKWDRRPAFLEKAWLLLSSSRFSYPDYPNPVLALDAGCTYMR